MRGGPRQSAKRPFIPGIPCKGRKTRHNTLTQRVPRIRVRDTWVDVHLDCSPILHKYLLQQHACNLAGLNVGVWNEVTLWSVVAGPAHPETLLFDGAGLNEDIALAGHFGFYATTEGLELTRFSISRHFCKECVG